jgi:hypothetical protein
MPCMNNPLTALPLMDALSSFHGLRARRTEGKR